MMHLEAVFRRVASDLTGHARGWCLVGGFAVAARSEPRFTRDIDIAVAAADDGDAEALVRSLLEQGYRPLATIEQESTGRLAAVRLALSSIEDVSVVVDLLFASSGIEPEIVGSATDIEIIPGLILPVARTGHLMALKLLARDDDKRPQDLADLRALAAVANEAELGLARAAVDLISERGYGRGRDLSAAVDRLRDC